MTDFYHTYDLPEDVTFDGDLAIDCEAMGLQQVRDRMCAVQISDGKGDAHVVHFPKPDFAAPRLKSFLADDSRAKILHFARFDVALIKHYLGVYMSNIFCTRTASRLVRTYTDRHGLKDVCRELLGVDISKQQQSSNWGADILTPEQIAYAASDVYYLHQLRALFHERLKKEGRVELAKAVMDAIPARAWLDLEGWDNVDMFAHS